MNYQTIERDGVTLDILTNERDGIRIMVSRLGAELVSLAKRDAAGNWTGFLYRDSEVSPAPSGWNNHSTVMGYFAHRLKGGRSRYRRAEIHGGTHGFIRHTVFAAPEPAPNCTASLTYRLTPDQIPGEQYPLKVGFSLTYTLEGPSLRVTFRFDNLETTDPAHVSFGLHPGFAVSSLDSCELLMPAGTYLRHLAPDNFLSGETIQFDHAAGPMPFDRAKLPEAVLLELKDVPVALFELKDRDRRLDFDFSEAPYVTLWSDGNPFLCVEPCWGLPDHHDQRPFESKLGIQEVAHKSFLERSFTITPHLLV